MLKEKKVEKVRSKVRNRTYTRTTYVYECDECHVEFERKKPDRRPMHFHSKECYQSSMRHGVANDYVSSQMTPEVIKRQKQTMLERHGVTTPFAFSMIQEKARQTCLERYGSPCSMGNPEVRAKKEATFIEHGLRLVRITDIEFKQDPKSCIRKIKCTKMQPEIMQRNS